MDFFRTKANWSVAELGLIKICQACGGIALGIFLFEYLKNFLLYFILLFFVTGAWAGFLWLNKRKH